jgi:hypothetical protein
MEDMDGDDIRPPDIEGDDIRPPPDIPLIAPPDLMPGAEARDATLGMGAVRITGCMGATIGAGV